MLRTMNLLPGFSFLTLETRHVSLFFLTNFVLVGAGRLIYAAVWNAAIHRSVNMNRLIAIGTLAAFGYRGPTTFSPSTFESTGMSAATDRLKASSVYTDTLRPNQKKASSNSQTLAWMSNVNGGLSPGRQSYCLRLGHDTLPRRDTLRSKGDRNSQTEESREASGNGGKWHQ